MWRGKGTEEGRECKGERNNEEAEGIQCERERERERERESGWEGQ